MSWQFTPYIIPLLIGATLSAVLAFAGWRRRALPGALPFTVLMLAVTEWSAGHALELASANLPAILFWGRVQYLGIIAVPAAWLVFTLQYYGFEKWLTRRNLFLLTIQPLLTMTLVGTDDAHHLIWLNPHLVEAGDSFLMTDYGPWLWVTIIYSYLLILAGTLLVAYRLIRSSRPYRAQATVLLLGALFPWLTSILVITRLNPFPYLDFTPFAFTVTGVIWFWGLFRFRLLDMMPVAQATIVKNMVDGVIVLNLRDCVLHVNPAAERLIGFSASDAIGQPVKQVFAPGAELVESHHQSTATQATVAIGEGKSARHVECIVSGLFDRNGRSTGCLLTLRDITQNQQAADNLRQYADRLQILHQQTQAQAHELRQRERHSRLLNEITQAAASMLTLPAMLQTLADRLGELVRADDCHITLWDEAERRTIPMAASGQFRDSFASIEVKPGELTMTASVLDAGHVLVIDKSDSSPYVSERIAALFPATKTILALPLIAVGQKLGAALLLFDATRRFTADEITQTEQAAQQIALAIAKTKFYDAARRQVDELATLNDIALAGAEAANVDELIERATQIISEKLYSDNFGVMLLDEAAGGLRSHYSYKHQSNNMPPYPVIPLADGIVGQVVATGRPRRVSDVSQEPDYLPVVPQMRSELCVPLKVDDRIIGVINTESSQLNAYSQEDERLLTTLAGQLATAIKKIRLLEAERLRRQEAETLREATAALTSTLDLNQLLNVILVQLEKVVAYDSASIFLFEGAQARIVAARGLPDNENAIGQLFPAENPLTNETRQTKRPIYLEDAQSHPAFQGWRGTSYVRGWIGVPLIIRDAAIGQLTIDSRQMGSYGSADAELALAFANQAAAAIDNAQLFQETHRNAEEQRVASNILRQLNSSPIVTEIFPEVAATLKQFTCCYRISLTLLDENPQWAVVIALDQPAKTLSVGVRINVANTAAAENVLNGRLNVTPDLAAETDFPAEKMLFDAGYRSRINIPLRTGDQVIGSLNLVWRETDGYDTTQFPLLTQIAEGIALAVERSRLFDETRRRAAELEAVANISTALRLAQTVDEILPTILEMSIGITAGAEGDVFLIEPKTGDLVSRGYYPPDDSLIGRRHAPGEGITGHVAATGGLYISEDLLADPLICPLPQENERLRHTQSSISLPLHAQDRVVGVMNIGLAEKRPFSNNEIRLLTAIAEIAGSALDRALLLETLEQRVAARTRDLAEANERLQELDQLKTKFVSDVSHELRTPITNLNLYLDLLEKGDPANHARYMSILRKQTTRLIDLIEDTLSLSRLDMGKSKIKFSPVSLNDIVTQVATAHLPRVTMAGLTLATDLQTDLPLARGERNQLAQVVTNLLANAINYTPDGHIAIQTYLDEEREQICLEVADTGLGIDPDDRRHLFERFYRGKKAGQSNIPGTGLGLAIVKEIVDLHNGEIETLSKVGSGSTFRVWLPLAGRG